MVVLVDENQRRRNVQLTCETIELYYFGGPISLEDDVGMAIRHITRSTKYMTNRESCAILHT